MLKWIVSAPLFMRDFQLGIQIEAIFEVHSQSSRRALALSFKKKLMIYVSILPFGRQVTCKTINNMFLKDFNKKNPINFIKMIGLSLNSYLNIKSIWQKIKHYVSNEKSITIDRLFHCITPKNQLFFNTIKFNSNVTISL